MKSKNLIIVSILLSILIIFFVFYFRPFKKESSNEVDLNVIEETNFDLDNKIDQNDISAYEEFIIKNQQHAKPISWVEFLNKLEKAGSELGFYPPGKTSKDLKKTIIEELNIGFLLSDLNQRELLVTITNIIQDENYIENELIFTDPNVGSFSVLLLIPNEKKDLYPAIIGLHGHAGNYNSLKDSYGGKELAQAGFVVIMPSFRAMDCLGHPEEIITQKLIKSGFTLMGIRIYETFLLEKYLKYKDFIDKIGIMGHSGGSDTAYLASIINTDFAALAFDFYPKPDSLCDGKIHCETLPGLAYYKQQINDPSTLKIPSKKFDYSFPGDKQDLIQFFKENL